MILNSLQPIKTDQLIIREITKKDLSALYKLLSDKEVMRYSVHGPCTIIQTKDWISFISEHYTKY